MDSPPQSPARPTEPRLESPVVSTEQQGAGSPSANGKSPLSAHSSQLPPASLSTSPDPASITQRRHPVFAITFILLALYLGVVMVMLPWRDAWMENSLLDGHPLLHAIVVNNFVRGIISGIGVLDIWLAISEAFSFRRSSVAKS